MSGTSWCKSDSLAQAGADKTFMIGKPASIVSIGGEAQKAEKGRKAWIYSLAEHVEKDRGDNLVEKGDSLWITFSSTSFQI